MMNTKLLEVVTPPSIYHVFSNQKAFCKEKFIGEENLTLGEFSAWNMKHFGRRNARKHTEIKVSDNYATLEI